MIAFDNINRLSRDIFSEIYAEGFKNDNDTVEEVEDEIEDLIIMAYIFGNDDANRELNTSVEVNNEKLIKAMDKKIKNKTWSDRVKDAATIDDIYRICDTEVHRLYNTGKYDTAEDTGKKVGKRWQTQLDDKVRESHEFIESVTVPLNERFYTFDGDSALFPGEFSLPENNVNCRCYIQYVEIE